MGTSSPNTIVNSVSRTVTTTRAMAFGRAREWAEAAQPVAHLVDQADRREGRGEEAEEVDADLDHREEAAGIGLEMLDPDRRAVALVDELLDPAAPERDERDLGRGEDPVEAGRGRR